ncbi:related to aldehyde dehydrogenase [Rhynchosporium graminicola]|uniref:Related to aldehyde dehydrogenase n=1 Tax=Rhynchosporium graminicola TaxID=2792576 RepID=A0A1E1KFJ9_9HELO|nr:related to aldehyde dehydrogenase [Rhynchosporium commune]
MASQQPPVYPLLINNKPHPTIITFPVSSPVTGKVLHEFSSASISDIDTALQAAQSSFPAWKRLPPPQKRDIFLRAADLLTSRTEELKETMMQETGAAAPFTGFNITLAIDMLRDVAGRISSIQGFIPTTAQEGVSAMVVKEPFGVALAIAPWNAPYILGMRAMLFPLAAGNTVILKAPEFSPRCSQHLVQALHDAGLPAGVLNLVAHRSENAASITKHLIESPIIKKINFTGSTIVGRIIAELAAKNFKPVLLELGGKAPAIICEDADLELAAQECAVGAFLHGGQICMSTERIIVFEKVLPDFEVAFKKAVAAFAPEGGAKPVLINAAGVQKNKKLVADAVGKGARVLHGDVKAGEGTSMMPVVVVGTKKDMDLFYTESFGPTVSVMAVQSEEEALELANDTEYGLNAAVFSRDLGRALRIAKGIECGAVHINGMTVHDETALPHGGVKSSGYGRFGAGGLEEWVRTKTITFKD